MTLDANPVPDRYRSAHRLIADLYEAAVSAVEPIHATSSAIGWDGETLRVGEMTVPVQGRITVVGMGKAAIGMAVGVERILGDAIAGGLIVTKDGHRHAPLPVRIEIVEAAHPLPDDRSLAAGERLLGLMASTSPEEVVVALISGGGSALAEALRPPLMLADLRAVTDLLLRAGATIGELNAVRRPMSRLKAGGLLAAGSAPVLPVILSDVVGNDLDSIASGAAISGQPLAEQARAALVVLRRYALEDRVPASVRELLVTLAGRTDAAPSPAGLPPAFVGDNARAVQAMVAAAAGRGLRVARPVAWQDREGEAANLGREFVAACLSTEPETDLVVGGGEATVTVRGDGVGGRNTEFALAAAIALAEPSFAGQWVVASLATDGQDALTGAAGAVADGGTVSRAREAGIDPGLALRRNDSFGCFEAAGGLLSPGPTGTNVNDLYLGIRIRDDDQRQPEGTELP